jgi:hypothetical protein
MMILVFLSALYTLLGLLCAATERFQTMIARRPARRRAPRTSRRSTVRRKLRRPGQPVVQDQRRCQA